MRSLRDIVRTRLRLLGIDQQDFALRAGVPPTTMSALLRGKIQLSRERLASARRWCDALSLKGAEADELIDAMHVSAAHPRVRAIIEGLERRVQAGEDAMLELRSIRVQGRRLLYGDEDDAPRR